MVDSPNLMGGISKSWGSVSPLDIGGFASAGAYDGTSFNPRVGESFAQGFMATEVGTAAGAGVNYAVKGVVNLGLDGELAPRLITSN